MTRLIKNSICRLHSDESGQGLVEYILVVFLMAILCIAVVRTLGTTTQTGFRKAEEKLGAEWRS